MKTENYMDFWMNALLNNIQAMADFTGISGDVMPQGSVFSSRGMAIIIGITGARPGRIILDTSIETARKLSEIFNGETELTDDEIMDSMAEFANIVSGHGITQVNNLHKGFALMLTPPSVFMGSNINITSPRINAEVIEIDTPVGFVKISIGFEGGQSNK